MTDLFDGVLPKGTAASRNDLAGTATWTWTNSLGTWTIHCGLAEDVGAAWTYTGPEVAWALTEVLPEGVRPDQMLTVLRALGALDG